MAAAAKQQSSKAAKQQSSKAAKQQSSKAAKQQSSKAANQQSSKSANQQNSKTAKQQYLCCIAGVGKGAAVDPRCPFTVNKIPYIVGLLINGAPA
jgi:FKBP-type peptidyl-prolyl cis-trans isomerase